MDNSSNINKPGNDKLSKKKFLNLGIETETSGNGITSASNEHIDPVTVTQCDSDPGTAGGSSDGDNAVKIQNKGADDLSVKADDACPQSQAEQSQAAITDSEGKGEAGGRVEEDIEVDDVAEPASSDFNNSSNNNELEMPKKNVNCDQERQEEPIEVDGADEVQPEQFDDGEKTKENGNEKDIDTKGLPKEEANTVPPSSKNADGEGEKLEATGTSKLNDLNKNDLNEEATGKAESIINTSISVATAANIDEDIDVDGHAPGLSTATESESDDTQEYSMKTAHDARQYVNYDKKEFETDSDFENSSDSNNQEASSNSKRDKEKRRVASPMGLSCTKSNKDDESPPRTKKQKSSSIEGEDAQNDPQDAERRKKDGENVKSSSSSAPRIGRLKRQWSDRDTQMYRQGYPGKKDHPKQNLNLQFYRNEVPSDPNGAYVDEIHKEWWDDHDRLESHHGYIQWLFPIRESGMNWHAQELQQHEAEAIQKDEKAMKRFIKSYEMMLNFYGLQLLNRETGEVDRAKNWRERFRHLNYSMHNYLRITRILKCLGELGLEHYKAPFLRHMLHEAIEEVTLDRTLESCYNYWIGTLRDNAERKEIKKLAEDMYEQSSLKD